MYSTQQQFYILRFGFVFFCLGLIPLKYNAKCTAALVLSELPPHYSRAMQKLTSTTLLRQKRRDAICCRAARSNHLEVGGRRRRRSLYTTWLHVRATSTTCLRTPTLTGSVDVLIAKACSHSPATDVLLSSFTVCYQSSMRRCWSVLHMQSALH